MTESYVVSENDISMGLCRECVMKNGSETRRLKIAIFSQPEYFRFIYEDDLNAFADVFEFKMRFGLSALDLAPLVDYQADYNFYFRGEYLPDGVLEQLHGVNVAFSSEPFPRIFDGRYECTVDSFRRYLIFRTIRKKPFDYVFHYDNASFSLFKWDRLFLSGQFPFPVATSVYYPVKVGYQRDLFFIGRSTSRRERYFSHLKHVYDFLHICHGVSGEPLRGLFSSSKICLNIHAENEVSWEPRMQMMLACGAFVISEKITPNPYLRPGIDYVEISSPEEMRLTVDFYLSRDDERLRIAKNGYERVRGVLDSQKNFRRLLADLNDKNYLKFSSESGRWSLNALELIGHSYRSIKRRILQFVSACNATLFH